MVSVDVKHHVYLQGSELRSCVKVEVAVLGSPSLVVLMVSVDVKQHFIQMLARSQIITATKALLNVIPCLLYTSPSPRDFG